VGVFGVAVMGGARLALQNVVVTGADPGPDFFGCQTGIGVVAGNATTNQVGHVTMKDSTVSDYAKGGIEALNMGSNAYVLRTTVTGVGPTALVGQNSIEIGRGASGRVLNSTISGNECDHPTCGPDYVTEDASFGVLVFDPGATVLVRGNTISGNDGGVFSCGISCLGYASIGQPHFVSVKHNTITNNRFYGIAFDQGPSLAGMNVISGGNQGIVVAATSKESAPTHALIRYNWISGTAVADVDVVSDGNPHPAPNMSVHDNRLFGTVGIQNQSTDTVTAPNNFFGDASGPSGWSFGSGSSVSDRVSFWPWATSPDANWTRFLPHMQCTHTGSGSFADSGQVVLCGTTHNDIVTETGAADVLYVGLGGQDNFAGGSGTSYVLGNAGADTFTAGTGPSNVQCGGPGDTLYGTWATESNC
jgi:hypothetical protein